MTTREVAELYNVAEITVKKWAQKDGKIKRKMNYCGIMAYDITKADCKRFESRPAPGWKKGVKRKKS